MKPKSKSESDVLHKTYDFPWGEYHGLQRNQERRKLSKARRKDALKEIDSQLKDGA